MKVYQEKIIILLAVLNGSVSSEIHSLSSIVSELHSFIHSESIDQQINLPQQQQQQPISDFHHGDFCDVISNEYFIFDLGGNYRVAGNVGCNFNENNQNCYCSKDNDANDSKYNEWKWNCTNESRNININNSDVKQTNLQLFGPIEGKMCPPEIPSVPYGLPFSDEQSDMNDAMAYAFSDAGGSTEESMTEHHPFLECDTVIHPTGHSWMDPPCGYSDCSNADSEKGSSAVCYCVDSDVFVSSESHDVVDPVNESNSSNTMGRWICKFASCNCQLPNPSVTEIETPNERSESVLHEQRTWEKIKVFTSTIAILIFYLF